MWNVGPICATWVEPHLAVGCPQTQVHGSHFGYLLSVGCPQSAYTMGCPVWDCVGLSTVASYRPQSNMFAGLQHEACANSTFYMYYINNTDWNYFTNITLFYCYNYLQWYCLIENTLISKEMTLLRVRQSKYIKMWLSAVITFLVRNVVFLSYIVNSVWCCLADTFDHCVTSFYQYFK